MPSGDLPAGPFGLRRTIAWAPCADHERSPADRRGAAYGVAPVSVSVPDPALVRLPPPEIALASVTSLPLVSKIAVWPLARAMNWLETSCVLPLAHCRVAGIVLRGGRLTMTSAADNAAAGLQGGPARAVVCVSVATPPVCTGPIDKAATAMT